MHSKLHKFFFVSSALGAWLRMEQNACHTAGGTLGLCEQMNDYDPKPLNSI